MQGDSVDLFKRYVTARIEAERQGVTVPRLLEITTLALGLGQPDKAFLQAKEVVDAPGVTDEDLRVALHLCAVAHMLKAAILEGDAAGAPEAVDLSENPVYHRQKAMNILAEMGDLQMEEIVLMRKLKGGLGLGYVTTHISSLVKGLCR